MNHFRMQMIAMSLASFLFSATGFSGQDFVKMSTEDLRQALTQKCSQTQGCKQVEIDQYVDAVRTELKMTHQSHQLLQNGKIEGSIDDIIRRIHETGFKVVSVTIQAGKEVVKVTGEQLERLYELPAVKAMVRAGEKTIALTIDGIEYSYDLTITLSKKTGIYQVTEVTLRTIGNVSSEVLSRAAKGTWEAIEFVLESKPVVLIMDGVEYLAKKVHLGEMTGKIAHYTWNAVVVFAEGSWNAVEFAYNGTLFILGLPVEFVKWIIKH